MGEYDELLKRLVRAQTASCTCMTKTPDIAYHTELCTYRLHAEAVNAILSLERKLYQQSTQ